MPIKTTTDMMGEYNMNYCVCCGEIIPEGRQVCLYCEVIEK